MPSAQSQLNQKDLDGLIYQGSQNFVDVMNSKARYKRRLRATWIIKANKPGGRHALPEYYTGSWKLGDQEHLCFKDFSPFFDGYFRETRSKPKVKRLFYILETSI
jgi:hypothetical protein